MHPAPVLSFVIPCFNEESCLEQLISRVYAVGLKLNFAFEVILVDDGSSDNSWEMMNSLLHQYKELALVKLSRNHGHQLALSAGLHEALGSEYIFILDADLQDPPELLLDMLAIMIQTQADVVYGQRNKREGETFFKLFTAKLFYRFLRFMTDVDIPADTGDFRLIRRCVLNSFLQMPEHSRFIRGMISWIGFKQVAFHYDRNARVAGETKYPLKKMLKLAFDAITSFSIKPLRLGVLSGGIGFSFGVFLLFYCLISYYWGKTVSGWTSTIAIIVIMESWQFVLLGLIGEYIGRIYLEAQSRPLFIIEKVIRNK